MRSGGAVERRAHNAMVGAAAGRGIGGRRLREAAIGLCRRKETMVFWFQMSSAISGAVAAVLWFCSASGDAPPMTYEGVGRLKSFFDNASRLNKWAAGVTGFSMLLSALASLAAAVGYP